jgi:hypothetical protein
MGSLEISVDGSVVSIVDLKVRQDPSFLKRRRLMETLQQTPYIDYQAPLYMTMRTMDTGSQSVTIKKLDSNLTALSDIVTTRSRGQASKGIRQRTLVIIIACAIGGVVLLLTGFLVLLARSRRVRVERSEKASRGNRENRRMSTRSANKVT